MHDPTLLMIRPEQQSKDFLQAFEQATGKAPQTVISPVISIQPVSAEPLPFDTQFILFTSANGVKFFVNQSKDRSVKALCVGDVTAQAARSAGFSAVSANGTAQDLITLAQSLANPSGGPLVYACGKEVAHNIDQILTDQGFRTERRVVYEQTAQKLSDSARKALNHRVIVPVSSPNTARYFVDQTSDIDLSQATILCISESVKSCVVGTNATVITADSPTRSSMISALNVLF